MVSMLASSVVYGGFKPLSGQTKSVKLVLDASLLSTNINGERTKTGWLGIRILCPSGATCLPENCCFSELAL